MKHLILLSLFVVGCVSVQKLNSKSYAAKSENCKLDIFITKKPTEKFEEIAVIRMGSLNSIKKKACLIGGDGIISQALGGEAVRMFVVIKYIE